MGKHKISLPGLSGVIAVVTLGGFIAACSDTPGEPAPVFMKGGSPGVGAAGPPPTTGMQPAIAVPREARQVTVGRGQSVGSLARDYHVSKQEIVAANHLEAPYKIKIGSRLVIPGAAAPSVQQAMAPPATSPAPGLAAPTPDVIPLDDPPAPRASAPPPPVAPASAPSALSAPPRTPGPTPSPAPMAMASPVPVPPPGRVAMASPAAPPPPTVAAPPAVAPLAAPAKPAAFPPREPSAAEAARAEPADPAPVQSTGGHFPWPLRGRVLASYGVTADGTHNDGINIAASRGTPIEAIDSGIVAYAGNELRGYGNLVLIKHVNGWISAYAHCDELLVKKGDPVYRGKIIAKVGATGGVSEPQLHFELRQGKRPVDPRGFLAPAPSA